MSGYFHYKKKNQVLTVYYMICPENGTLKCSSSLWKKNKDQWNRKKENEHAFMNFENSHLNIIFEPFIPNNLTINYVWLKKFIHQQLSKYTRNWRVFKTPIDVKTLAYKEIIKSDVEIVKNDDVIGEAFLFVLNLASIATMTIYLINTD